MTNSYGILAANLTGVSLFHREFHPVWPGHTGRKVEESPCDSRVQVGEIVESRVYFNVSKMSYICFSHLFYYESDFKLISISFRLCIYIYIFFLQRVQF